MMLNRTFPALAVVALALILWVVPSIGSQGMGTIGERFVHADRSLLEVSDDADERLVLRAADAEVEAVLAARQPD